ncbi:hypothetical protein [Pseudoalteromonas sp. G4]|uniref:hypothetical protein n=1 Tax=Pseudoalteromonas sp. G4 TaxID=2992761 RepID=UPI00237E480C|nr:hypothetical protein [Pseudoalteromonas sp. G4]MDE3273965.1 hypothetical protein [Pseudoalteromonas sp. G4]
MENNRSSLWQIYQTAKFTPFKQHKKASSLTLILSVWNAFGQIQSKQQNRVLEQRVFQHLRKNHIKFSLLWGGSESMLYRELSIALEVNNLNVAKRYAQFAKQKAFYVVKSKALYLVKTIGMHKPLKLGHINKHTKCYPLKFLKFEENQALAE